MRATAEAAEAACFASEHVESPTTASADLPTHSAASVKPLVPKPPVAPPVFQENASLALQRAGAVMLGTLCELHWSDTPQTTNGADIDSQRGPECAAEHAEELSTCHGTVVKGSCLKKGKQEQGGSWTPCHQHIIADECPVDVMCVQATTLLKNTQFADALPEFRHVLTCLRSLCVSSPRPGPFPAMDHCQPYFQLPRPPVGLTCAPVQCNPDSVPTSFVLQDKPADAGGPQPPQTQTHTSLPSSLGVPESMQQALSVLGPLPAAAFCWKNTTLTFLGTGSSEPSKYRGPSALLLDVRSHAT